MTPFHWIDWLVVLAPAVVVLWIGLKTRKHVKGVADFTSGGRVAGRYLLTVATGEAGMGLVSLVAMWELYYRAGFTYGFWGQMTLMLGLFMTLTGYVGYRLRETRCLTIAQFLEVRYSRGFRIYSAFLCVLSGIVNFGIFPAVSARFVIYFTNLPPTFGLFGLTFTTYGALLALAISIAYAMVWFGGQVTLMVTDCVQGIIHIWMYLIIVCALFILFSWDKVAAALVAAPGAASIVDPFDAGRISDFNIYYILIGMFASVLNRGAWQGAQGYSSAALNPHEAKMAAVLGQWRVKLSSLMILLIGIVGFAYLNHPDNAVHADAIREAINGRIENEAIRSQALVPMAISNLLPVGLTGLFFASMLILMVSTDNTYMHSWGTILFQDCVMPFTKKPLAPRTHLMCLRMSALFVAVFAWFFSHYFAQTSYILMFFAVTGAIYSGGAGACIVGGLYWKRGGTLGAYAAMTAGSFLAATGVLLSQPAVWRPVARWLYADCGWTFLLPYLEKFPVNGQYMLFFAMVTAVILYVALSLAQGKTFNLDRMLHRGAYAVESDGKKAKFVFSLRSLAGITDDYTRGDRWLAWSVFLYTTALWLVFLATIFLNVVFGHWSRGRWIEYFFYLNIVLPLIIGIVTGIWFTWGGIRDLKLMFQRLRVLKRNANDDGRVVDHVSAADLPRGADGRSRPPGDAAAGDGGRLSGRPGRAPWPLLLASALVFAGMGLPWLTVMRETDSGERVRERVVGLAIPADAHLIGRIRKTILFHQADARISDAGVARMTADKQQAETEAAGEEYGGIVAEGSDPAESGVLPLSDAAGKPARGPGEAAREMASAFKEKQRIADEALAKARDYDVASAPPTPWAAWALILVPALAAASFATGLKDRKLSARLGLGASLGAAALLFPCLLYFSEHLGPVLSGLYPMSFAIFLLFAASMATLESSRTPAEGEGRV